MSTEVKKLNGYWSNIWDKAEIYRQIGTLRRDPIRPYVLKYLPRNGIHIEAGCGLSRYVFYLFDLGFNIIGMDISEVALEKCKNWANENGYDPNMFKYGDVRTIPYPDNYFSSYISFGVVEHFEEGPIKALKEAYRVLSEGGIIIVSTPNKYAYDVLIERIGKNPKFIITKTKKEFYQYEYSVNELANFVKSVGFEILEKQHVCLKWPLYNISRWLPGGLNVLRLLQPIFFPILDGLEKTPLKLFSSGSMVVAIKPSNKPHCFFCGEPFIINNRDFSVPICQKCYREIPNKSLSMYKKGKNIFYKSRDSYKFNLSRIDPNFRGKKNCFFCGKTYNLNQHFGDYGFSVSVCPRCLKDPLKNLELSNFYLKYSWFEM